MRKIALAATVVLVLTVASTAAKAADTPTSLSTQKSNLLHGDGGTPVPDLKVDKVFLAKYVPPGALTQYEPVKQVLAGDKVFLVCKFTNDSNAAVSRPWKIGYYMDDALVRAMNFGAFAAHRSQDPASWWVATAGLHTYKCVLDYENAVYESNEDNNSASVMFFASSGPQPASAPPPTRPPTSRTPAR